MSFTRNRAVSAFIYHYYICAGNDENIEKNSTSFYLNFVQLSELHDKLIKCKQINGLIFLELSIISER